MSTSRPLDGRVAVVAGATRGAGRAIAICLGEAGATVYCTGRSVGAPSTPGRPETTDETAALVAARGGRAVAVQVDHTRPEQVAALFARVATEAGRLDVLVNNVNGDDLTDWSHPFWESSLTDGLRMLERGVASHVITSHAALPLMVKTGRGLIAGITDLGTPSFFYGLVKGSVIKMAALLAPELRAHGIAAVAVAPGFLRSEAMLEHFGVTEATWRDGIAKDKFFAESETPFYVGRAVAALAADPDVLERSGQQLTSWGLAEDYGFTDVDGRKPHWDRFFGREMDAHWAAFVDAVRAEAGARGLDPAAIAADRAALTVRLPRAGASPRSHVVTDVQLLYTEPATLAATTLDRLSGRPVP